MKDFSQHKEAFKAYLRSKPQFADVDFDGSNISILTDFLSYVASELSLETSIATTESNIKTAQLRGRVASYANNYGYVGRSVVGAVAEIKVVFSRASGDTATTMILPFGTTFATSFLGEDYIFSTEDIYSANIDNDGKFVFPSVRIKQGVRKTIYGKYDSREYRPQFIIPDVNVDTTSIKVIVRDNANTEDGETYLKYTTLENISGDSKIFFVEENYNGTYQIRFGDGINGKRPSTNNIIEVSYVISDGEASNGARVFSLNQPVNNLYDATITTLTTASGGMPKEDKESIRFNAPLIRASQNRCITDADYLVNIKANVPYIETLSVWGGENNNPPLYNKVVICIKPQGRDSLTDAEKDQVWVSIQNKVDPGKQPVFVNPDFTYIAVECDAKYLPSDTLLAKPSLENAIKVKIEEYSNTYLQKFDGVFRTSNLSTLIDATDKGIKSNLLRVYMIKDVTLLDNINNNFTIDYGNKIYTSTDTTQTITSTPFLVNGEYHYIADKASETAGIRTIYMYKIVDDVRVTVINDVGKVKTLLGEVEIYGVRPDVDTLVKIKVLPESDDLIPKRNQLLKIRPEDILVTAYVDTILLGGGAFGLADYVTSTRGRLS